MLETIREQIDRDCEELDSEDRAIPMPGTIDRCLAVAEQLAPVVAKMPDTKLLAFVDEEGGIALVVRSESTGKRVTFRIVAGKSLIPVTVINGNVTTTGVTTPCDVCKWLD